MYVYFFFSSRRRHTRCSRDWSSDVCSSDLSQGLTDGVEQRLLDGPVAHRHRLVLFVPEDALAAERKSVVEGKRGDLGGRRIIKKKKKKKDLGRLRKKSCLNVSIVIELSFLM